MVNPFITPPNEKSFSSLIDDAIMATGKPGSFIDAQQAANLTIRECQAFGLFARDLREEVWPATATPFTITRPANFRKLRTAKYGSSGEYPKFLLPGRIQRGETCYFYAADNYFVFSGIGLGENVLTAVYYWSSMLGYYAQPGVNTSIFPGGPYDQRLAYFDLDSLSWMYKLADGTYALTTGDLTVDDGYRRLSSHWLIEDWYSLILSGTKAKIWNKSGDPRGNTEYGLYKQNQMLLKITSGFEAEGF